VTYLKILIKIIAFDSKGAKQFCVIEEKRAYDRKRRFFEISIISLIMHVSNQKMPKNAKNVCF
jgi:hypothetical protein